jgi:carbon-monoxide dehydrogenase medium subunit
MKFDRYLEPTTITEGAALLKQYGMDARLLAGGTDLIPRLKNRMLKIGTVIGLQSIPDLFRFEETETELIIGSMVTLRNIQRSAHLKHCLQVISEGAGHVSSMQVRNIATMGGNICNASPSADTVPALLVSDAVVNIDGAEGPRKVALNEFFTGPGKTVLKEGEIVVSFSIPRTAEFTGASYQKFAIRGDTDITIVGAGSRLDLDKDGKITDARIALAAVAPTPIRMNKVEEMLVGKKLGEKLAAEAGEMAADMCSPISDQRGSAEYRKEMVRVWVRHALLESDQRARLSIEKAAEKASDVVEWTYYG